MCFRLRRPAEEWNDEDCAKERRFVCRVPCEYERDVAEIQEGDNIYESLPLIIAGAFLGAIFLFSLAIVIERRNIRILEKKIQKIDDYQAAVKATNPGVITENVENSPPLEAASP